jgi:hypothetical protein
VVVVVVIEAVVESGRAVIGGPGTGTGSCTGTGTGRLLEDGRRNYL